jgi:uncharacterized repeat protein (TIGR01451 family)
MKRKPAIVLNSFLLIMLLLSACTPGVPAPRGDAAAIERTIDATTVALLHERAETAGQVPVIAGFAVPGLADDADDATRAAAIARERAALLQRLNGQAITNLKTYEFLPVIALTVDSAGITALANDRRVISLEEDQLVEPELSQSVGLIRADYNHIAAYTGTGQTIAVLDTGVDRFHPDLAGKVVSGACYSTNEASSSTSSTCPGGATSSTAIGSSGPCTGSGCDHGTAVASIAAAVAPSANIIAIQVFSLRNNLAFCNARNRTSPCVTGYSSDILAGLNRVFALRNTYNIAAVNLSLGGGRYFEPTSCDTADSARRAAIQQLRNAGIITVAGAGNDYYTNSMIAPACLSNVLSVAASDKSDQIAEYSNISAFTTVIAPGSAIFAAVPGSGTPPPRASSNGTSLATPHVAGVVALLRQAQPNATVAQITNAIQNNGPQINDNRPAQPANSIPAGSITKRRVDAFLALCQLITCDADDFRIIQANQTLNGAINPTNDVDNYYFFGNVGDRLTIRLNRTSGSLNPFLELFSPNNVRVAFNADGGGGTNSLINGYTLPQTGRYVVRARGVTGTGNYQLITSRDSVPLNPTPRITRLSPGSATATPFGSDFWVAIYGQGFTPESEVRWNGALRTKFYSSPELIYIRVRGSDINIIPVPPRLAFITVRNPTPGGGTSNSYPFNIMVPFLGETELVAPASGAGVEAGLRQTFVISWTHPTDSWRTMQRMDMRLRDPESGRIALWLRVVEQPGPDSTFRLLNATAGSTPAGEDPDFLIEGVPGSGPDLAIPGQVTLHMDESAFLGSGRTATMTPTLSFDPSLVGTYTIEFEVDSETPLDEFGNLQKDDVLGTFTVLPPGCSVALADVALNGPATATTGATVNFSTSVSPLDATTPISYTWKPEPLNGQGTPNAAFSWDTAGEQVVAVQTEHCGGFAANAASVAVSSGPDADLAVLLEAPAVAQAGAPIIYTLTVANNGAAPADDVAVRAALPAGATYQSGGTLDGETVRWSIPALPGAGTTAVVSYTVTAQSNLLATDYGASLSGGPGTGSVPPVATTIQAALAAIGPLDGAALSGTADGVTLALDIPGGAAFAETAVGLTPLDAAGAPFPAGATLLGPAFLLSAYQDNTPAPDFRFGDRVTLSFSGIGDLPSGRLRLVVREGATWTSVAAACAGEAPGQITCQATNLPAGELALLVEPWRIYLPTLRR